MPALLLALALAAAPVQGESGFRVVVHPSNAAADDLSRAQLSQLFLKKTTRWPDGRRVLPVEPGDARVRDRFCRAVHGKSLAAIRSFWLQQIYAAREVPPLDKATDAEVVRHVRRDPDAIGYVSARTDVSGVKVVNPKD